MVSIIIKEWTTKIELVPTVQKRNAAVLLRKPGRLAPQYARTNKGKTYVTISDHLSQSSVKDGGYISGAKYDTLAEAYSAYEKLVKESYSDYKETLPK